MVVPAVADASRDDKRLDSPSTATQARISAAPHLELPASAPNEGSRLFAGLLCVYVVGLAILATLSPFNFLWSYPHSYSLMTSRRDFVLNLALLFPAGFLFRLARAGQGSVLCLDALGLGLGLSLAIEGLQAFLPSRVMSPIDVLTNALGAWAGAFGYRLLARWFDRRLHKQLGLHLPLVHILYLLVPLCSLDALTAKNWRQTAFMLPLAAFMAWVAAALYKHRLRTPQRPFAMRYALVIGAVFGVGYLPVATRSPRLFVSVVLVMVLLTRLAIACQRPLASSERRFVLSTIRGALPWFVLYLLALASRSWFAPLYRWADHAQPPIILLRDVAAFTLLGYLVSELHGRTRLHSVYIVFRAVLAAVAIAFAFDYLRDHSVGFPHHWRILGLLPCAAFAGAIIHRAQLRLIRRQRHSLLPPEPGAARGSIEQA